jgi:hypothetical protein
VNEAASRAIGARAPIGGEILLEAAAQSNALKAVVSEGAERRAVAFFDRSLLEDT